MIVWGSLILLFWLGILPVIVGSIFTGKGCINNNSIVYRFMSGNMLLWAVFQVICVPCVVKEKSFVLVVTGYVLVSLLLFAIGIFCGVKNPLRPERSRRPELGEKLAVTVFAILLLLQVVCAVVLTYADGDDAFYVAVSSITNSSNTMYMINPYSVGATELDVRHGLAPFPVWIAFLARVSGLHTTMVAHVIVAVYLILMSYGAFYLVGVQLFRDKKQMLPPFMVFVSLQVLFGDNSFRTPENFMLARSRQGKAAMGSIIIPMIVFLMLVILNQLKEARAVGIRTWIALAATVTAACLCTTLGTFLTCMMIGVMGICSLFVYKKWRTVGQMALCCIPAVCFALLYFVLG
ncbi:MAG: hypothetical protein IJZ82_06780 [Lachnospiraceae bacterium]|nr:hypothetical protein [Lachnospiraceae bacterium]